MVSARIDDKGRLSIPASVRDELGIESGDVMFLDVKEGILRIAKATNPFDALVEEALAEYEAGETISIEAFAEREGVTTE